MKKKYDYVVFDLGNVLLPFNYSIAINRFNKIEQGLGDRFYTFAQDNYELHRQFEAGQVSEEKFLAKMLSAVDNKVDRELFCRLYSEIFTENIEITALLPEIKKNFGLVLLSNTNSIHQEYGWRNYKFLENFDKLVLSHEVRAVKPEPEIYKAVEKFTKCPSDRHIFIDDISEYALGAEKLGWESIHYLNPHQTIEALKNKEII